MPLILRDIVKKTIVAQPDMEVVEELDEYADLLEAAALTDADFAIVSRTEAATGVEVFGPRAHPKVLALERDGRQAYLYELEVRKQAMGELSPDLLVSAIRANARPRLRQP